MTKSSRSGADRRVIVGRAGAPHGVKGELRVVPMTDFPERFRGMREVYLGDELVSIKSVRYQNEKVLMAFEGFDTREAAAALTGRLLSVRREDAVPLEEGEYYTFDIIGLEAVDTEGNSLGRVADVLRTGSNDVYVVAGERGELMVPALKSVVKEISVADGRMVVDMPEETEA